MLKTGIFLTLKATVTNSDIQYNYTNAKIPIHKFSTRYSRLFSQIWNCSIYPVVGQNAGKDHIDPHWYCSEQWVQRDGVTWALCKQLGTVLQDTLVEAVLQETLGTISPPGSQYWGWLEITQQLGSSSSDNFGDTHCCHSNLTVSLFLRSLAAFCIDRFFHVM